MGLPLVFSSSSSGSTQIVSLPMLGQPSVIARLMGMEDTTLPAAVPAATVQEAAANPLRPRPPSSSSSGEAAAPAKQFIKCSPLPHRGRIGGADYYRYCLSKMKPRRRSRRSSSSCSRGDHRHSHPQEELLEKIKEDFRASWQQASMVPTPQVDGDSSGRMSSADRAGWVDGRYIQRVAQENLRREKMARHGHGAHAKANANAKVEDDDGGVRAAVERAEEAEQLQQGGGSEVAVSEDSEELCRGMEAANGDHGDGHARTASEVSPDTPTRITILRPIGTARGTGGAADDRRELALGTPPPSWKAARDGSGGGGMEVFLRAVKERLDNEMKAKTGAGDAVATTTTTRRRLWGSPDPEQQSVGDTARRIREAAGLAKEDLGRRLSRLESFRVFRGDRGRRDAAAVLSPEHRMLKRVRARIEAMSPKKTRLSGCPSPVSSRGGRVWSSPPADAGHASSFSDDDEKEEQSCCTGDRQRLMTKPWKVHGAARAPADADVVVSPRPSPRALVRSFSAPASSGVSSGAEARLSRSRSFSLFRGTMASGIGLGGKLLMTMMHLSKKKPSTTAMDCPSPPQDSGHLITAAQADFLAGLAPPSPVSPLEVHGRHFPGGAFVPESSPRRSPKCSSELEASVVGGESPWRWTTDATAAESDYDPDKAYVRELLMAAGLLDDNEDGCGESWEDTAVGCADSMIIMSDDVFEEVEDMYYYRRLRRRVEEDGAGEEEEEEDGSADRRRLLFDLANEALQALQAGPSSLSSWVVDGRNGVSSRSRLRLRGRDLEDEVWRRVARAMTGDGSAVTTVDGMVEREVWRAPWMALREDVCAVGRKVERAIFDELVDDVVRQVFV